MIWILLLIEFFCCQICWESNLKSIFLHVYRGATCCMYVLGLIQYVNTCPFLFSDDFCEGGSPGRPAGYFCVLLQTTVPPWHDQRVTEQYLWLYNRWVHLINIYIYRLSGDKKINMVAMYISAVNGKPRLDTFRLQI